MQVIPKKIHYIWFGKGEKSELICKCIETTRSLLPDWEIHEWTENEYDVSSCAYMKEAYDQKKYAFASDYARFDLLYKYGGVYLDTDVELLKRIPDGFLEYEGFTGVESNNKIAPGLIFACAPGNPIVKEILDQYREEHFINEMGQLNAKHVVTRVTDIFARHGFIRNGKLQVIDGFYIYPSEFFCAYDFITEEFTVTEDTISIHHYTATWTNRKSRIKKRIQRVCRSVFGINGYKKMLSMKRKIFGVHGE